MKKTFFGVLMCIIMTITMSIPAFAAEYQIINERPIVKQQPEYISVYEDGPCAVNRCFVENDKVLIKDSNGNLLAKESETGLAVYLVKDNVSTPYTIDGRQIYVTICR